MRLYLMCIALLMCGQFSHSSPPFPRTVTDMRGTKLVLVAAPRRIVSLAPGVTEMLWAVGVGRNVVGDTTFCDYPPQARHITHIGDVRTNYESVLALHPDLIVASDANRAAADKLSQLGVRVLFVIPTSFAAIEQSVTLIGRATGNEVGAVQVVRRMDDRARQAQALASQDGRWPRVLCVVGLRPLWTAGAGTFVQDVLSRAGTLNVASQIKGYGPLSPESVFAHPPDWVVASPSDAAGLRSDPVLSRLPAVRTGRVMAIDADTLLRPGPRLADALLTIAAAVHGSHAPQHRVALRGKENLGVFPSRGPW